MPLRGKILNTWEADTGEVLQSQEVHNISIAIGVDPAANDLSGLRYHKICILADADSDGQHIATLLCALFLRHYRPLVAAGHVYVCMPPLFRIDAGKEVIYALDEAEREKALKRIAAENPRTKPVVTRFKGLGEMSPLQLRETTMAPQTRRLVQMTIDARDSPDQMLDMLLAKKTRGRPAQLARIEGQSGAHLARGNGDERSGTEFRGCREGAAQDLCGARLPRLFHVRDSGPGAAFPGRRPEARAAAHRLCHERARPCRRRQAQEIGAHRRRRHRQIPSARRLRLLRGHGAHGAGLRLPLSHSRRAGQLGFDGRSEVPSPPCATPSRG